MTKKSEKSYTVSVALCGVFGLIGIHHFYLGNLLHGIFDLSLLIFGSWLIINENGFGYLLILIDIIHSIIIFYKLITEQQKDSKGLLVKL